MSRFAKAANSPSSGGFDFFSGFEKTRLAAIVVAVLYRNQWRQSESWFRLHLMIAASFSVDKGLHKSVNLALYKFHMKCVYLNQKWVQDQFIH